MTVAIFIYQHIYCRYLCPGECIIHDRGELCNKVAKILAEKFNCSIRVISAGRPQANGQAEAYVKNLKTKMKAKMVEASQDRLPNNWDETLLHVALQALRCDPAVSTGYAPAELLLGRSLVYPIELDMGNIDTSGTNLTQPLADKLISIHNEAFGQASKAIAKHQERYCRIYDAKHKTNPLRLRRGTRVQIFDFSSKKSVNYRKGAMRTQWKPFRDFYRVHSINRKKGVLTVRSKGGRIYKKQYPISRVRLYKGKK